MALTLSAEPKFAILAEATAVFPRDVKPGASAVKPGASAGKPKHAFVVLDIAIEAVVDPLRGTVLVAGELTPRSFVLSESCHLTGGFALAYFLPGSDHAGDWVFSVGGYHPHFKPPAHYPTVPGGRVGISWQFDDHLHIGGEAYFAICPQAAMGGARMDAVLDLGWVRAGFSAYADFFMHFHPFFFEAEVGIALFASVNLDCDLFTINLGPLEFSADLALRGPPIRGEAHVHLWRWSIDVCFGPDDNAEPPALELDEFLRMVRNVPADADKAAAVVPTHVLSVTRGAVSPGRPGSENAAPAPAAAPTPVLGAHLTFEITSRVPVLAARLGSPGEPLSKVTVGKEQKEPTIYSRPMQEAKPWQKSLLEVCLRHCDAKGNLVEDKPADDPEGGPVKLSGDPLFRKIPPALWGLCASLLESPLATHTSRPPPPRNEPRCRS